MIGRRGRSFGHVRVGRREVERADADLLAAPSSARPSAPSASRACRCRSRGPPSPCAADSRSSRRAAGCGAGRCGRRRRCRTCRRPRARASWRRPRRSRPWARAGVSRGRCTLRTNTCVVRVGEEVVDDLDARRRLLRVVDRGEAHQVVEGELGVGLAEGGDLGDRLRRPPPPTGCRRLGLEGRDPARRSCAVSRSWMAAASMCSRPLLRRLGSHATRRPGCPACRPCVRSTRSSWIFSCSFMTP